MTRWLYVVVAVVGGIGTASAASAALAVFTSSVDITGNMARTARVDVASHAANDGLKSFASWPSTAAPARALTGIHRFVGVSATPIAASPGGPAFATLYVSAPVVIVGTQRGMTHISTTLWMHGDPPALGPLYTTPMGVDIGRLDAMPAAHAILRSAIDGWTPVEIDGYLVPTAVVDSLDAAWLAAEFSYHLACAECHQLHAPNEYSSMQWRMIMTRMARFAKLGLDDATFILKWLQTTSSATLR